MKVFQRFRGYRVFISIVLVLIIGVLVFTIFYLSKASQPPYQFIFNLVINFAFFNFLVFLVTLFGISDSFKVIEALKKLLDFTKEIKKGNFEAELNIDRKDEVGELAKNLDLMRKDLKASFERLKKEEEKAVSIVENVGEGILVIDKERKIIFVNPRAERITGFKKEDLIGKKYFEILKFFDAKKEVPICQSEESEDCFIEKAIVSNKRLDISQEIYLLDRRGKKVIIDGNIYPVFRFAGGENVYIFSFHDVTTEKEIERMKDEFISITSHQLRTPLSSIRWYSEMLLSGDAGRLKPKQQSFLQDIHESTITAINLIDNLLDVQRIESGRMVLDLKEVDLKEIVKEAIKEMTAIALASNAKLVEKIEDVPLRVKVDPSKISQVFLNIILNAIVYNKGRGDIIVSLKREGDRAVFSCKDNGIGIPIDEQKNIFKKFYRASNTLGVGSPGSGIGLYICKVYVEEMNGKIWFKSKGENKGTTFFVSLPLV